MGRADRMRATIIDRIESDTLTHAVLLTGARGIGKSEMALWIAAAAVCEGGDRPCRSCEPCRAFHALSDLDLRLVRPVDRPIWVEREKLERFFPGGISAALDRIVEAGFLLPLRVATPRRARIPLLVDPDAIFRRGRGSPRADRVGLERKVQESSLSTEEKAFLHDLLQSSFSVEWYRTTIGIGHMSGGDGSSADAPVISFLGRKPAARRRKVVILEEAERMTEEAQNSLLKTLEEPPADSLLILTSSRREGLLDTIRSRCEEVRIPMLPAEEIAQSAARYFVEIDREEWEALLLLAEGVPGDAAQIDLERYAEEKRKAEDLLAAAETRSFHDFFPLLHRWIDEVEEGGKEGVDLARWRLALLLLLLREKALSAAASGDGSCFARADGVFRAVHRTVCSIRPGANVRLLMEELGGELWKTAPAAGRVGS